MLRVGCRDEFGQLGFALGQRQWMIHQGPETRQTILAAGDQLAIDDGRSGWDLGEHRGQGPEPLREVGARFRVDRSGAVVDVNLSPPTDELDLVQPLVR